MISRYRAAGRLAPALLAALVAAAPAAAAGPEQVTAGSHYDRNPVLLRDGNETLLLFARSQEPCDRLAGCDADNSDYDLYVKRAVKNRDFGPATLAAENPDDLTERTFRGRTIAATRPASGDVHAFWASGGNSAPLFHVAREDGDTSFGDVEEVELPANVDAFNVEAVSRGKSVLVYVEEWPYSGPGFAGVAAYRYVGGELVDRTEIAAGQSLPKVIVDDDGVFRMVVTDGTTISVASSLDGLHFSALQPVVTGEPWANWDPSVSQHDGGRYAITYAPNQADGSQRIEAVSSADFATWSAPVALSDASDETATWWDYWPEALTQGPQSGVYFTSERPIGTEAAGTGHIWSILTR